MGNDHRRALGALGECTAARILGEEGLEILDRNWRDGPRGELDLVARDARELVIVEVRTRIGDSFGSALESVDPVKVAKLRRLAIAWARAHAIHRPIRIDVIAITVPRGRRREVIAAPVAADLRAFGAKTEWVRSIS